MIKRIKEISDFGSFQGFVWPRNPGDLPDFDKKNILYGWNYSGKTTISRIFASIGQQQIHCDYANCKFKVELTDGSIISNENIENSLKIEVFNVDFIKNNLHWDTENGSDSIAFDIGEDVHGYKQKQKQNNDEISRLETSIAGFSNDIKTFEEFEETRFTVWGKDIRRDIFNNAITFNKTNVSAIVNSIKNTLRGSIISDNVYLQSTRSIAIQVDTKSPLSPIIAELSYRVLRQKVADILASTPKKGTLLKYLDNQQYYDWAKHGLDLEVETPTTECPFCGGGLTQDRLNELAAFFSNEEARLREMIVECRELLNQERNIVENLDFSKSENDYMSKSQAAFRLHFGQYNDAKKSYLVKLSRLEQELARKENGHFFNTLLVQDDLPVEETSLSNWISAFNTIVTENNNAIRDFTQDKESAKLAIQKHYIASYMVDEKYLEKQTRYDATYSEIAKSRAEIAKLESENKELEAKLDDIVAGQSTLNDYISSFLGRNDVSVILTEDKKYLLTRDGNIAKNLSEGEKMAIAFAYFLVRLEGLQTKGELVNTIVFIDDPISSLDINHISQVYSLINSFFFRKGLVSANLDQVTNCFLQLFISTHNFEFFSFLKDSSNRFKGARYYLINRGHKGNSTISRLPNHISKYQSEYVYLFSLIQDYHNSTLIDPPKEYDKEILIPNAIRRFIEIYSLMKLPHKSESFENRFVELVGDINQVKMLNHFSHFTSFEKIIKHDDMISILPKATEELMMLLKKDVMHYNSLIEAIK